MGNRATKNLDRLKRRQKQYDNGRKISQGEHAMHRPGSLKK